MLHIARIVILVGIMAFVIFNPVSAAQFGMMCKDNMTLAYRTMNTTLDPVLSNITTYCPNGCAENLGKYGADCVNPTYINIMIVIAVIIFLAFLIIWAGRR